MRRFTTPRRPGTKPSFASTGPDRHADRVLNVRERRQRLGTLVRLARKRRGLSQANLARMANLSTNVVGAIERGGTYSIASLEDVALTLGWPVGATEAFLRGDDDAIPRGTPAGTDDAAPPTAARRRVLTATARDLAMVAEYIEGVDGERAAEQWLQRALRLRDGQSEPAVAERDRTG